tara:strand:+ start:12264 stop:12581 length:318 start_codon:yes stop_codon:yes gene_type:complete
MMDKAKKELYNEMIKIIASYDLEAAHTIKYSTNISTLPEVAKEWGWEEGWDYREKLIDDLSKLFQVDENAETLEDKLRVEHTPIPEEREDASLFETMGNVFRPKV